MGQTKEIVKAVKKMQMQEQKVPIMEMTLIALISKKQLSQQRLGLMSQTLLRSSVKMLKEMNPHLTRTLALD